MAFRGNFVWHELATSDLQAAAAFYGACVPWTIQDSALPDMTYLIASAGPARVAGFMALLPHMRGMPPAWMGYVGVDDVDATTKDAKALGATVHREPMDIPHVGRFAVIADPQGAVIMPFTGAGEPPLPPVPGAPGLVSWNELMAGNWEAVFPFYEKLFGWTKGDAIDMGPMGVYQLFNEPGGVMLGGMMTKGPDMPGPPHWRYYIQVDGIHAAMKRVVEAGGKILNGPHPVPGGSFIIQALDPQGAFVGFVSAAA